MRVKRAMATILRVAGLLAALMIFMCIGAIVFALLGWNAWLGAEIVGMLPVLTATAHAGRKTGR